MIAGPLLILIKANLAASAATCIVLALRKLARYRLGSQAAYRLWTLPPLAVAASLAPARRVIVTVPHLAAQAQTALATLPAPTAGGYSPLLLALWGAGIALSLAVLIERQRRFMARLGKLTATCDPLIFSTEGPGVGPAVIGVLSPRIVLPADFEDRYTPAERIAIMIHERGHLLAGHIQINGLVALIRCIFWFNPFIHIAAHALRFDQELACDARVLSQFPAGRRAYGEALLRTQLNALPLPLGCYLPPSGAQPLKERLLMLKSPPPARRVRLAGSGLIALITAVSAVAAWAAQPPQVILIAAPLTGEALQKQIDQAQASLTPEQRRLADECAAAKARPHPNTSISCNLVLHMPGPAGSEQTLEAPLKSGTAASAAEMPHVAISNAVAGHKDLASPKPTHIDTEITQPDWIDRPTAAEVKQFYPADAVKQQIEGLARVRCQVGQAGKPYDCSLQSETPEGAHFGDAAIQMAETFTMKPPSDGGSATVIIPIRFQLQ